MNKSRFFFRLIFLLIFFPLNNVAPQTVQYQFTLDQVIALARQQSPDALAARNRFLKSFWEFRTSEALLLPKFRLQATVPQFTRSIDKIIQPDGSEAFRERSLVHSSADLSLSKNISLTGGQVFLRSGLQRIDYLNSDPSAGHLTPAWLTTPVVVGYSQNIFGFNPYKWSKRIDPLKFNEARRRYLEELEQISIHATNLFFNLLISQIQKQIAQQNIAYYDTLYRIGLGRFNLGRIGENDLLQLELNYLNAQTQYETASLDFEDRLFKLKSYLRLQDDVPVELLPPVLEVQYFDIPIDLAIQLANQNNSQALAFERRLLEAERSVEQARTTDRFSANFFAQYGLTQSAYNLPEAYQNPQNQQILLLGLEIPILDWGLARGRIKIAESDREILHQSIEQERIDFNQQVYLQIQDFRMQRRRLEIAAKADTVARKSYEIARQRYLNDRVSITDLTMAQINSDNARISFFRSLQNYWVNYFQIRKLTMYDFLNGREISVRFEDLY